jgi:hypothetical protein
MLALQEDGSDFEGFQMKFLWRLGLVLAFLCRLLIKAPNFLLLGGFSRFCRKLETLGLRSFDLLGVEPRIAFLVVLCCWKIRLRCRIPFRRLFELFFFSCLD